MNNIIVRADFYPDGSIIPLCITFENGISMYIHQIKETEKIVGKSGSWEYNYHCFLKDKEFFLSYKNNMWYIL